jgi:ATP-dependent DNA helicase DinG
MKREAEAAQIVVVNHHLFFADLALRGPHPARVIPDYDAVVFDEAHQLEDIATDFFGIRVSQQRIDRILRDGERAALAAGVADPLFGGANLRAVTEDVRASARALFDALARETRSNEGRTSVERDVWQGTLGQCWHRLDGALEAYTASMDSIRGRLSNPAVQRSLSRPGSLDALELASRRSESIREQLAAIVEGARGRVTWFERSSQNTVLSSSPIDVASVFRARVFETIPAVVLTSATLTNSPGRSDSAPAADAMPTLSGAAPGSFTFVRERLGVPDSGVSITELVVPSPFDFERRSLFYTPRDLPPPSAGDFIAKAARRIHELIEITQGGAFVLTTSLRSMRALHTELERRLVGRKVLMQGQMPKGALVGTFRALGDAVLVATSSFWEGVDVPGRALRLVVLEKIPFPVPTDPIVQARTMALESEGKNPFMEYHVPAAALTLKQGFGRLIRSRSDAGVVALLDQRVHHRGYARRLLSSLPGAHRTDELAGVRRFWERLALEGEGAEREAQVVAVEP